MKLAHRQYPGYRIGSKKVQEFAQYLPNLFDFHRESFERWTQINTQPSDRKNHGMEYIFRSFFPIVSKKSKIEIHYLSYELSQSEHSVEECKLRGINYAGNLKVNLRLINKETNEFSDHGVLVGQLPLITDRNTFVINGHERIFISQVYRCPGAVFTTEKDSTTNSSLYIARVYPYRGLWLHIFSKKDGKIYVSIDKKKELSITSLLMCFPKTYGADQFDEGYSSKEIIDSFYNSIECDLKNGKWYIPFDINKYRFTSIPFNIYDSTDKLKFSIGERVSKIKLMEIVKNGIITIPEQEICNSYLGEDIFNAKTGEIFGEAGDKITPEIVDAVSKMKKTKIKIFVINDDSPDYILKTWNSDKISTRKQALAKWAESMRIGTHYTSEDLAVSFGLRFFDPKFYTLETFGRERLNKTLGLTENVHHLTMSDLLAIIKRLIAVIDKKHEPDDIDSLVNRRLKRIEDSLDTAYRIGVKNFVTNTLNRIAALDSINSNSFSDVINLKVSLYPINEMFNTGPLAQLIDDTNYFSLLAHYRKISLVGPGGLGKKESGISIQLRLVNISEYGRVCPVQSPQGQNIGLVRHLSQYARIDENGFICSPFYEVKSGEGSEQVVWLTPFDENRKIMASLVDYHWVIKDGKKVLLPKKNHVMARKGNIISYHPAKNVDYIDVSPNQIFSLSAGLIPFPEKSDSYRILTAANMSVQALHVIEAESPVVGTGLESLVADVVVAKEDSIIEMVNSTRIVARRLVESESEVVDVYDLIVFEKTGHDTCRRQRPIVHVGQVVKKGEVLVDGFTTKNGELALGRNLKVVYVPLPWTYEDAFILNENCQLTSLGVTVVEANVMDTRHGQEVVTRDVPGVNEDLLMKLDEYGVVRVGTYVRSGNIVLGKITPQAIVEKSPEQKLLSAIFGEKAGEYTNSSITVPHGVEGIVTKVKILNRKGIQKDGRSIHQDKLEIDYLNKVTKEKIGVLVKFYRQKINEFLSDKPLAKDFAGVKKDKIYQLAEECDVSDISKLKEIPIKNKSEIEKFVDTFKKKCIESEKAIKDKIAGIKDGYELADGVIKTVSIYITTKQKIEAGDKLCGRYGNKGVISAVWPNSDMPYLENGETADLVISPVGIMARMNLGQIYETIIANALERMKDIVREVLAEYVKHPNDGNLAKLKAQIKIAIMSDDLNEFGHNVEINRATAEQIVAVADYIVDQGLRISIPQFSCLTEQEIDNYLKEAGIENGGKTTVYDGRTGEKFQNAVLFGIEYIYKLCHLVSGKMHARSVGAYSYTNLQPLAGKARFGGQRVGEMEGWALQSHGAASTLLDTILNSDSITMRNKLYKALASGRKWSNVLFPETTKQHHMFAESFWIFAREMMGVGIKLVIEDSDGKEIDFIGARKIKN